MAEKMRGLVRCCVSLEQKPNHEIDDLEALEHDACKTVAFALVFVLTLNICRINEWHSPLTGEGSLH